MIKTAKNNTKLNKQTKAPPPKKNPKSFKTIKMKQKKL